MCINCGMGLHDLCEACDCCKPQAQFVERANSLSGASGVDRQSMGEIDKSDEPGSESPISGERTRPKGPGGRVYKIEDIQDPHSTGRKRAAVLYPLLRKDSGEPEDCDWRNKTNCGGGKHPIVGCIAGTQQSRHHGPDKNTLNNSKGNVHRICHKCHNTWHAQNDPTYDPENPGKHEPETAGLNLLTLRLGGFYRHEDAIKELNRIELNEIEAS